MSTINRKDLTLIVPACCFTFFLLDENGRPMTALKNDVSFSDLNLPVEEWLTRDFKVTGCNGIIRKSRYGFTLRRFVCDFGKIKLVIVCVLA